MTPYTCTKASNDTVLLVEFTQNSDTIALVGQGWRAEMNGDPTPQALGGGYFGLTFPGNTDLTLKHPQTLEMQSFTIEVVADSNPHSPKPYLSMKDSFWMPMVAEDGTIGFDLCVKRRSNSGCEEKWVVKDLQVPEGVDVFHEMHHYALSYDSTQHAVSLFVDGALVHTRNTPTDTPNFPSPQRIRVGGKKDDNEITIYFVRLSNRAKSAKDFTASRICKMPL